MPQPANQPSLKGRALRALAAREYSRAELQRKLSAHVQEGENLDAVLTELTAKGFLSDARAAESVINRRSPKLGAARVLQELKAKGVDSAALQSAAISLRASELERAREVWHKKFGQGSVADDDSTAATTAQAAERARQMRFLASRGFAPEVIRRVLKGDD